MPYRAGVSVHEFDSLTDKESTQPQEPSQVVVARDPETVHRHPGRGELRGEMFRCAREHVGNVVSEPLAIAGCREREQQALCAAHLQPLDEV